MDLALKPILQFPDVWQNLTYLAGYFKIILALIVITSVCNEFNYGTARQNTIDGFTRRDWLFSKIGLAKILALCSTSWVFGIGLILGYSHGVSVDLADVFGRMDFVLAYFIELVVYFTYAIFLALVLKRTGLSVILLLAYDFILEPILSWSLPENIGPYLPMNAIDRLNTFPFGKYVGTETLLYVPIPQMAWAIGFGVLFGVISYWVLKRSDL